MMIKICSQKAHLAGWEKAKYANVIGIVIRQLKEFHAKIKEEQGVEISYSILVKGEGVATWIDC
jgi:hypothetical protein